jgi:uncharacterized protein (TIGR03437 family)
MENLIPIILPTLCMIYFCGTLAAQTAPRLVLAGNQLQPPFDLGIDTSGQKRDWLVPGPGYLKLVFPAAQQWAALFVTVGQPVDFPRPFVDLSAYDTLQVEMRADVPATVGIGLKTNTQPDDGTETRRNWTIGTNWETHTWKLSEFAGADPRRLYAVFEIVYSGNTSQTVYLRGIRYTRAAALSCLNSPPQVAGWWPGDGDAADIVGGASTIAGDGVAYQQGIVGQAFSLDGRGAPLSVVRGAGLDFDANVPFTVEMWVNPQTAGGIQYLAGKMEACNPGTDALQMSIGPIGLPVGSVAPGVWSHLAYVVDRGSASFYVNGALTVKRPLFATKNSSPWLFGGAGSCPIFRGLMDEVIIHSRALTLTEINDEYGVAASGRCKSRIAMAINSASGAIGGASPASLVSIFGGDFADGSAQASGPQLPKKLLNVGATLSDASGKIYDVGISYVSPPQMNLAIPAAAVVGPAVLTVNRPALPPRSVDLTLTEVAPGLFSADGTGKGIAAAVVLRVKPTLETASELAFDPNTRAALPIDLSGTDQVYLLLFGSGIRRWTKTVAVTVGGQTVDVKAAVAQPQYEGLDQINVGPLPASLAGRGAVSINLTVDGQSANPVTVAFR